MIDQKNPKIYINKGLSLNDLRQSQEAIQCYEYAIMLDPQNWNAYMNKGKPIIIIKKGNTLRELGRYQEAIQYYDIVIKLNPKNSKAFNNKGLALFNLKRNEEALVISCFNSSIFLDPNISDTYNYKGVALFAYQRYNEALIEYQNAIHLNPKEPYIIKIRLMHYDSQVEKLKQISYFTKPNKSKNISNDLRKKRENEILKIQIIKNFINFIGYLQAILLIKNNIQLKFLKLGLKAYSYVIE